MFKTILGYLLLFTIVAASRISYELVGHERACFYHYASERHLKAAFYFSVYRGEDFEIDYVVSGPGQRKLLFGNNERQGDFVFTVDNIGEYEFCMSNPTSNNKILDFDIAFSNDEDNFSPLKFKDPSHLNTMEKSLQNIQIGTSALMRDQRMFRTREGRNEAILNELANRVHSYSISVVSIAAIMAVIQVLAIRSFFSTKSRY